MTQGAAAFSSLIWGIKASLASYVRGLEDGQITVQSPAEEATPGQAAHLGATDAFAFPPDRNGSHFNTVTQTGLLGFRGTVSFSGHFSTMRVELCDPRIELKDGTGTLSVRTNGRIGNPRWDVIATATTHPVLDRKTGITISLELTSGGHLLFGQQYPVGQALDPAAVQQLESFQRFTTHLKQETR